MISNLYTYVVERLPTSGPDLQTIADETGLSMKTLQKIARGDIYEPGVHKMQKLADYFRAREVIKPAAK